MLVSIDVPNTSQSHYQIHKLKSDNIYSMCKELVDRFKIEEQMGKYNDRDARLCYLHAHAYYLMANCCQLKNQAQEKLYLYNSCDSKTRHALSLLEHVSIDRTSIVVANNHTISRRAHSANATTTSRNTVTKTATKIEDHQDETIVSDAADDYNTNNNNDNTNNTNNTNTNNTNTNNMMVRMSSSSTTSGNPFLDGMSPLELLLLKSKLYFLQSRALLQSTIMKIVSARSQEQQLISKFSMIGSTDYSDKFFQEVCLQMDNAQSIANHCLKQCMGSLERDEKFFNEIVSMITLMHFYFGTILTEWSTFRRQRWEPLCDKAKVSYEECLECVERYDLSNSILLSCLTNLGTLQLYQIRRRRELSAIYSNPIITDSTDDRSKTNWVYSIEDLKLIDKCIETWERVMSIEQKILQEKADYHLNEDNCLYYASALFEKANTHVPSASVVFELHSMNDSLYDDDQISSMLTRSYSVHDLTFKTRINQDRAQLLLKFSERMKQLQNGRISGGFLPISTPSSPSTPPSSAPIVQPTENSMYCSVLLSKDVALMLSESQVTLRNSLIERGIQSIEATLRQNPNNAACLLHLGRLFFELGAVRSMQSSFTADCTVEFDASATQLLKLIEMNWGDKYESKKKMAYCLLGEVYFFTAKYKQKVFADAFYAKTIEIWHYTISETIRSRGASTNKQVLKTFSEFDKKEYEFREDLKQLLVLTRELRTDNLLIDGDMIKLGAVRKSWKERYFTLTVDQFSYFESRKTMKVKGRVATHTIKSVTEVSTSVPSSNKLLADFPFLIDINCGRRTFRIGFKTSEELKEWISALNYTIDIKQRGQRGGSRNTPRGS